MRKLLILSAATLAIAAAGPAFAETLATTTSDLNVRSGPSPYDSVIGFIPRGETVSIGDCTARWCSVATEGGQGWVHSRYLAGDIVIDDQRTGSIRTDRPTSPGTGAGAVTGGAAGVITGAVVGGPAGAAVGGVAGVVAGGTTGAVLDPPRRVRTYVSSNRVRPVYMDREVVIGGTLPDTVELREIPDYDYRYVYVNDQPVLVEPGSRRIVYVVR